MCNSIQQIIGNKHWAETDTEWIWDSPCFLVKKFFLKYEFFIQNYLQDNGQRIKFAGFGAAHYSITERLRQNRK